MVLTLKTAIDCGKRYFSKTDEINVYLKKIVKLTNRKYATGYNSLKEMRKLIMMKYKEFSCYDYHQDQKILDESEFSNNFSAKKPNLHKKFAKKDNFETNEVVQPENAVL